MQRQSVSRRVKAYEIASRAVGRARMLLSASWMGFWLGLLDRNGLRQITNRYYENEEFYADRTNLESGLIVWEREAIEAMFPKSGRIIVVGAGAGREVFALARMGYQVDGFDCSASLIQEGQCYAQNNDIKARLRYCEPDGWPDVDGTYDAALIGLGAYAHIPQRDARVQFLKRAHALLKPQSPIMLSFGVRDAKARKLRIAYAVARVLRWLQPGAAPSEFGDELAAAYSHLFTEVEIEHELRSADFALSYYSTSGYGHAVGVAPSVTV